MDKRIITFDNDSSSITEKYRILRTNIKTHFIKEAKKRGLDDSAIKKQSATKLLTISSSTLGEGKSVTTANLAVAFAKELDAKVLLVDCDLREGAESIQDLVGDGSRVEFGLADALTENATLNQVINQTKLPSLYYITKGSVPINPSELLGSQRMIDLIATLKKQGFSYILFDTPSILSYTDAGVLGAISDGVLYVVKAGETQYPEVKKGLTLFAHAHADVIGFILNDADPFI